MKRPRRSSAANKPGRADTPAPAELLDVGRVLLERGTFGVVWCTPDLVARRRVGALVDFVPLGEVVTLGVLPLFGLDQQIQALRRSPDTAVDVPNVAIVSADGATPRLNLTVLWIGRRRSFVLVAGRAVSGSELESELARATRARSIAEATVVERSKEIERANRDLDEFARIVSHDLKAPLRALCYLVDDIETALGDPDGADLRTFLSGLREQSRRMSHMLTDLLAYSRIGRKEEAADEVDTRALVEGVVRSIPRPSGFAVEIEGDWPALVTLSAPLDLVLRNLVENAIKHHDRESGRVRIVAARRGAALEIEVSDDGPGIESRHHEVIFQPFRRLGSAEGSGIGLSLVRKTVEIAGGRIELVSDPAAGRGATFKVRWPVLTMANS
jgi:signal transduction histidine kinase